MESLDSIFVAGITDKKATSEQVDSLVEEMAQSLSQASKESAALDLIYSTLEAPAERKIETPEQLLASAQKIGLLQDSDYEISDDYAFDASEKDKSMTPEQRSSLDEEMAF